MSSAKRRNAESNRRNASKKKKRAAVYVLAGVIVILVCVLFGTQIIKYRHKNAELEKRKERLETLLSDEDLRQKGLCQDQRIYRRKSKINRLCLSGRDYF